MMQASSCTKSAEEPGIPGWHPSEYACWVPYISDPPHIDGRWAVSTLHHELTHLASIRATRLGWVCGIEAARLLHEFRSSTSENMSPHSLVLSEAARKIVGVFYPILEGLALFTELHFEEESGKRILPNPIPFHASMVAAARMMEDGAVHRVAREDALLEFEQKAPGLFRELSCDQNSPDQSYYLVDYLWVRAVAAIIERLCPRLGRPAVMLPLLIKLLCDHPVVWEAWKMAPILVPSSHARPKRRAVIASTASG